MSPQKFDLVSGTIIKLWYKTREGAYWRQGTYLGLGTYFIALKCANYKP